MFCTLGLCRKIRFRVVNGSHAGESRRCFSFIFHGFATARGLESPSVEKRRSSRIFSQSLPEVEVMISTGALDAHFCSASSSERQLNNTAEKNKAEQIGGIRHSAVLAR